MMKILANAILKTVDQWYEVYKECVKGDMYLIIIFEYCIVVGSSSIHGTEYKSIKEAPMLIDEGISSAKRSS